MATLLSSHPPTTSTEQRSGRDVGFAAAAYLAIAVAIAMEALRVLFPVIYTYEGDAGVERTALVLVVTMLVPAFAVVAIRRAGSRPTMVMAAIVVVLVRVTVQTVGEISLVLAAAMVATALFAVVAGLLRLGDAPVTLASGLIAGLALDVLVRGATLTWDLAWRPEHWPYAVIVVAGAALIMSAVIATTPGTSRELRLPVRAAFAFGPYLFFQVLFVQSPAYVASSAGVALSSAIAIVLLGDLAAIVAVAAARRTRARWRPAVAAVTSIGLAASAWALTGVTGSTVIVVVVVVQLFATWLLVSALQTDLPASSSSAPTLVAATSAGLLAFSVLLLEYQLHYETPLPFSNRWLPVLAAIGVAGGGIGRIAPASVDTGRSRLARLATAIAVTGAIVVSGLALSEPNISAHAAGAAGLRVMTYNVDETVTRHGQLDPTVLASAVKRIDPDVLVVPESGRGWPISSTIDLAEWAKRQLGMRFVWAPAADHQFGTLMFSRIPIRHARVVSLPQGAGTMKRSAIIAEIGPVNGQNIVVIGTHLQNGHTPAIKQTRSEELDVLLRDWGNAPRTIIAGDLNSDPGSRELQKVLDAGFSTTQPAHVCTLKTSNNNCVDWILVTPDLRQGPPSVLPIDSYDHRPLTATVASR